MNKITLQDNYIPLASTRPYMVRSPDYGYTWRVWQRLIDNSSTLRTVPSLQTLEEQLIEAARWGRTEIVISPLDKGVNIEASNEVRQVMG